MMAGIFITAIAWKREPTLFISPNEADVHFADILRFSGTMNKDASITQLADEWHGTTSVFTEIIPQTEYG